jgi:hypothetical protein
VPNHYTNLLYVFEGPDAPDLVHQITLRGWGENPFNRVAPMPAELKYGYDNARYDWEIANRGCKWDAYDMQAPIRLPGDVGAVQITFCSAWNPPNTHVRGLLARELLNDYGASRVVWVGLQPFNDTFEFRGEWTPDQRRDAEAAAAHRSRRR